MSNATLWAEALHLASDDGALRASVLRHIRDAVRDGGYVSRGRITSGIKEAYRPLGIGDEELRSAIEEAIESLLRIGDINELATSIGRGYATTPPRRLFWGGADDVLLGAVGMSSSDSVRRIARSDAQREAVATPLVAELGRPAWRDALVELGGSDQPAGDATALSAYAQFLASSGERYSLDGSNTVAVLSGSGDFFGSPDGPSGRWARASQTGFYPAVISSGYAMRYVLLAINDGASTLWEPPSRDIWRWIVVGFTLAAGQQVFRYDPADETLAFFTPPPRQIHRAALLTGRQLSAWSWRVDIHAEAIIAGLMGPSQRYRL